MDQAQPQEKRARANQVDRLWQTQSGASGRPKPSGVWMSRQIESIIQLLGPWSLLAFFWVNVNLETIVNVLASLFISDPLVETVTAWPLKTPILFVPLIVLYARLFGDRITGPAMAIMALHIVGVNVDDIGGRDTLTLSYGDLIHIPIYHLAMRYGIDPIVVVETWDDTKRHWNDALILFAASLLIVTIGLQTGQVFIAGLLFVYFALCIFLPVFERRGATVFQRLRSGVFKSLVAMLLLAVSLIFGETLLLSETGSSNGIEVVLYTFNNWPLVVSIFSLWFFGDFTGILYKKMSWIFWLLPIFATIFSNYCDFYIYPLNGDASYLNNFFLYYFLFIFSIYFKSSFIRSIFLFVWTLGVVGFSIIAFEGNISDVEIIPEILFFDAYEENLTSYLLSGLSFAAIYVINWTLIDRLKADFGGGDIAAEQRAEGVTAPLVRLLRAGVPAPQLDRDTEGRLQNGKLRLLFGDALYPWLVLLSGAICLLSLSWSVFRLVTGLYTVFTQGL